MNSFEQAQEFKEFVFLLFSWKYLQFTIQQNDLSTPHNHSITMCESYIIITVIMMHKAALQILHWHGYGKRQADWKKMTLQQTESYGI